MALMYPFWRPLCVPFDGRLERPLDCDCQQVCTSEDTLRTQLYREKAARKAARRESRHLPLSAFLKQLRLRVDVRARRPLMMDFLPSLFANPSPHSRHQKPHTLTHYSQVRAPADAAELGRVAQLTARTNQMNSTLLRFPTLAEVQSWLAAGTRRESIGRAVVIDHAGHPSVGLPLAIPPPAIVPPAAIAPLPASLPAASLPVASSRASAPDTVRWVIAAWVDDRFGQYGLVGCALCHLEQDPFLLPSFAALALDAPSPEMAISAEGRAQTTISAMVVLETFNLSCRALRRGVEIALLKRVARDARVRGALWLALPLIESEGERKGNLLMQRFMARLQRHCCCGGERGGERGDECGDERGDERSARHVSVTIGKAAERRGVIATALVLGVSDIDEIDAAAWLDAEADAEADAAGGSDGLREEVRAEAALEEAVATAGSVAAAAGTLSVPAHPGVRWSELLDEVAELGAEIVDKVAGSRCGTKEE